MIVLDASVLIAYLDGDDAQHQAAVALLASRAEEDLAAGVLTLAEILVVPVRDRRLGAVLAVLRDLEVTERSLPPDAAVKLARLRVDTGLKMPDCAVLLTAEEARAQLASFDDRLAKAAAARGLDVLTRA